MILSNYLYCKLRNKTVFSSYRMINVWTQVVSCKINWNMEFKIVVILQDVH